MGTFRFSRGYACRFGSHDDVVVILFHFHHALPVYSKARFQCTCAMIGSNKDSSTPFYGVAVLPIEDTSDHGNVCLFGSHEDLV